MTAPPYILGTCIRDRMFLGPYKYLQGWYGGLVINNPAEPQYVDFLMRMEVFVVINLEQ